MLYISANAKKIKKDGKGFRKRKLTPKSCFGPGGGIFRIC
jgi:hypothetical protein